MTKLGTESAGLVSGSMSNTMAVGAAHPPSTFWIIRSGDFVPGPCVLRATLNKPKMILRKRAESKGDKIWCQHVLEYVTRDIVSKIADAMQNPIDRLGGKTGT